MLQYAATHCAAQRHQRRRVCLIFLLFLISGIFPALLWAADFSNGQSATLVLGQQSFQANAPGLQAYYMDNPSGVAVDPATGKVFVVDTGNNRVLRFASASALVTGISAEGVLGHAPAIGSGNR
jgi:NHL repeat